MQGYDDINKFKKTTGVVNYKILSEYNIDHALKKWNVIERLRGSAVVDAVFPQNCGMAEFEDIPPWHPNEQLARTAPVSLTARSPQESAPVSFISSAPTQSTANNNEASTPEEGQLFRSLFNARKPQPDGVTNSGPQRDIPLKTLFGRTSSCP